MRYFFVGACVPIVSAFAWHWFANAEWLHLLMFGVWSEWFFVLGVGWLLSSSVFLFLFMILGMHSLEDNDRKLDR